MTWERDLEGRNKGAGTIKYDFCKEKRFFKNTNHFWLPAKNFSTFFEKSFIYTRPVPNEAGEGKILMEHGVRRNSAAETVHVYLI